MRKIHSPSCTEQIERADRFTLLVAEFASLELDIREGDRNHHQPLTPAQLQLAASAVAEKLGKSGHC